MHGTTAKTDVNWFKTQRSMKVTSLTTERHQFAYKKTHFIKGCRILRFLNHNN